MKALRIIGVVVLGVVVVIALLCVLALTPAVQTWAVRKATANQPGLKLDVGRVAAGFSSADLGNVRLVKDGMVITADHANARYSAWDFIRRQRINVDDLTVEGLVIDLRGATPTPPAATATRPATMAPQAEPSHSPAPPVPAPRAQFTGILNHIQLPYLVRIARFSVPGRIILTGAESGTFEVRGTDITTGQRGTVDWKADLIDNEAESSVHAVHTAGTATVHITTERRIDLLDVNGTVAVEGPQLPSEQLTFAARAEQPAPGGNEGYNARFALIRGTTNEPLFTVAGQYEAAAHVISGAWNATVRSEQLTAILSGLGLPDTAVNGSGKFSLDPSANAATATGELECDFTHLGKFNPDLSEIGALHVHTKFDGRLADDVAHLGQFALEATAANGQPLAEITTLQAIGFNLADKKVSFANAQTDLARVNIHLLPLAWAQPFLSGLRIERGQFSLALSVTATPDGSHIRVMPIEPVTLRDVTIRKGSQTLVAGLTLTAKPQADYSGDKVHAEIAEIAVSTAQGDSLKGKITADIAHPTKAPAISFSTDLQARIAAGLQPYASASVAPFTFTTNANGTFAASILQVSHANLTILGSNQKPVTTADLRQPLVINLQTNAIAPARPGAESAQIRVTGLPLAMIQPFVANSKFGGEISTATIDVVMKSIDDLTVNTAQPVTVRGASVLLSNRPMLRDVDLVADISGGKQGETVKYEVRKLEAKAGGASLLSLAVAGDARLGAKLAVSGKGRLTADAAALGQQPAIATIATLAQGKVQASFDAAITDTLRIQASVVARGLVAKQENRPLGDANLDVTATVQPDGSSILNIPFTLTNGGRKSDLLVNGKLSRTGNRVAFDGKITSNALFTDDLMPLAALAPSSSDQGTVASASPDLGTTTQRPAVPAVSPAGAVGATPSSAPTHDAVAFWNAVGGKIDIDLKHITYGRNYVISGVSGTASITPTQLALNPFGGQFKDNPFRLSVTIQFNGSQAQPYTLSGGANFQNVDVGALLQPFNPSERPKLETTVTVDAKLDGNGSAVGDLLQHVYGKFDVTGTKGVLRALSGAAANVVSKTSLGLQTFRPNSEGYAAVADLLGKLAEMPFDKFAMHAERGADLNIDVTQIDFLSPDTHLSGSGTITNQPGVPIQNQPMQFTLQLAGKDQMAYLMKRAGVLGNQQDALGYQMMAATFQLRGTPAKTDAKDLGLVVGEAAVRAYLQGTGLQQLQQNLGNTLQKFLGGH